MACLTSFLVTATPSPQPSSSLPPLFSSAKPLKLISSNPLLLSSPDFSRSSFCLNEGLTIRRSAKPFSISAQKVSSVASVDPEPLRIMISGAPASGKGTQCEFITKKYGLVHISAGDLLREEVAAGSENGKRAKECMEKGQLVPNEIVVMMVKERLLKSDSQEKGWLLDGYPRSLSQSMALEELGIRPDLFILLDVSEEILVERVVGRRLDPVTGKIYHLKYSPPETEEIAARLIQRFDDTEEKVKLRLQTHHQNVKDVLSIYEDIIIKVDGNALKEDVFAQIDSALSGLVEQKGLQHPCGMYGA
ncbi:adenylate kinase, chloroplastic-like [Macadamia integrifolia]|uniref:adenylate kinase, chloroplastic-like n=1 Tax=Macadamia integrifolia TaxID=60698 RepID=UPI001C4EFB6B|nr:adenylate kinase, chloroplastic-like [Macadamia integrifolia]